MGLAIALAAGCDAKPAGPVERIVDDASADAGVPRDLILAIAEVEGGLHLPLRSKVDPDDAVPVAGVLEIRHGQFDSLARGAALMGMDQDELRGDLSKGTLAGARVLADLGRDTGAKSDDLGSWASAVEAMSGHRTAEQRAEYRARVYDVLRRGGELRARGSERIVLDPHDELRVDLSLAPPQPEAQGTPEYAGAIWFDTSCSNKCDTSRNTQIDMIAIHDTEGGWDASVATLQNDGGKSVHYIVDHDGSRVGQFLPESYTAWHVGNYFYNSRMVGIEHVGYAGEDDYLASMYETSASLVDDIAARHDVALDRGHIVAHQEVPDGVNISQQSPPCSDSPGACIASGNYGGAGHHTDPGVNWEWCQYMEMVGGSCKCNDTFDLWNCVHDGSMMNRCHDGVVEIVHCADPCVVEPIGTDDHCTPVGEGTGGAGGGTTVSNGVGGSDGGGSGVGGEGVGGGSSGDDSSDEGCSCRSAGTGGDAPLTWLALPALAGIFEARRRSAKR